MSTYFRTVQFEKVFGKTKPTLPLKEAGKIVHGNACRLDWEVVCPKEAQDEIYILGNPPFQGSKDQSFLQKQDVDFVFKGWANYRKLDYISCWVKLGSDYIKDSYQRLGFVSTNSICQGEQVSLLWPYIHSQEKEIQFAFQSFHWKNNAKDKAGVTCIILGIGKRIEGGKKFIYTELNIRQVSNINPYLIEGPNLCIFPRMSALSSIPKMIRGSQPTDGGNLILSPIDKVNLINTYPDSKYFIKRYVGADDFLNNKERWCLWIKEEDLSKALEIPLIKDRINKCKEFRLKSKKQATRKKALMSYRFDEVKHHNTQSIILPIISSHRRDYIPIGFLDENTIISNKGQVIYNAKIWMFSVLCSKMHMVWLRVTSSRMRKDYQYSNKLSYNTFPFPSISTGKKEEITQCVFRILEEREKHPEKTLAQLYDPDKMPDGLREAHHQNDLAVERCYRSKPFESDEERLEYLFKLYEKMIQEEQEEATLFQNQS